MLWLEVVASSNGDVMLKIVVNNGDCVLKVVVSNAEFLQK